MVSATPHLPQLTLGGELPNLVGLPKRRLLPLLPLLEEGGLQVALHGSGYVTRQEPAPGVALTGDHTIQLWLE